TRVMPVVGHVVRPKLDGKSYSENRRLSQSRNARHRRKNDGSLPSRFARWRKCGTPEARRNRPGSAAAELLVAALSRVRPWRRAGALVLVAEDQPPLLEVVGRHLDGDTVACQRLDAVLLHLAGGVGNDLVSGIELHPIPRVGKDLGHESFELDQ